MLTDAEVDRMRIDSASAMPDTCTVTRPQGTPVFDPSTGSYAQGTPTTVFTGACRVRTLNSQDIPAVVGDLHETKGRYIGTLPHTAVVQVDDFLTVAAASDAGLVGRVFRITDVRWSSFQVDRRVVLEELQQP